MQKKFSFLAAGFCPKNNGFSRVLGAAAQPPYPLARMPMLISAILYVSS